MSRYFVADLHFGHKKVSNVRFPGRYQSDGQIEVDHHDSVLISQMSKLTRGDQLWVLGDISCGKKEDEETALNYLYHIREATGVQLHLIAGNHDSVSSIHKDAWKRQKRFLEVFDSVQQFAKLSFGPNKVLLSHFPYADLGDGPDRLSSARYLEFRLPDVGMPLIHGHTHQTTPHTTDRVDLYCVSWDVHRGLVKEDVIQEWVWSLQNDDEVYHKAV